jgi:hypothetical protein
VEAFAQLFQSVGPAAGDDEAVSAFCEFAGASFTYSTCRPGNQCCFHTFDKTFASAKIRK